jgi:hypothetical protein
MQQIKISNSISESSVLCLLLLLFSGNVCAQQQKAAAAAAAVVADICPVEYIQGSTPLLFGGAFTRCEDGCRPRTGSK